MSKRISSLLRGCDVPITMTMDELGSQIQKYQFLDNTKLYNLLKIYFRKINEISTMHRDYHISMMEQNLILEIKLVELEMWQRSNDEDAHIKIEKIINLITGK